MSTLPPPQDENQKLPRHGGADDGDEMIPPPRRKSTAIAANQASQPKSKPKPEYFLVLCYILLYLELGWLILMLLRFYSRH